MRKDKVTLQARRDYAALQCIALHAVQQETASGDALTRRTLGCLGGAGAREAQRLAGSATAGVWSTGNSHWPLDCDGACHHGTVLRYGLHIPGFRTQRPPYQKREARHRCLLPQPFLSYHW
jgi:hypothetical protein